MVKEKGKVRLSQAISSRSFLYFPFSLLPFLCTSSFLHAPFIPLIDVLHLWKWRGFGSVYDYRIQNGPSQREGGRQQGHMKEKMKSDLIDPRICGRKKGGRGAAK